MSRRTARVIAALMCLALLATAGAEGVTLTYADGRSAALPATLDELLLNQSSRTYSPELARLLMALAAAAYNDPDAGPEAEDAPLGTDSASVKNLSGALRALGFDGPGAAFRLVNYYKGDAPGYGEDSAAFALGRKRLPGGETLALVVIRGSHCKSDWDSNYRMDTGRDGAHAGFSAAAGKVLDALSDFLGGLPAEGVRYVLTGHSRGAAVANLLAVKLHDAGVPNARVYDYNFACPDVARQPGLAWGFAHGNIFNICNTADLVCALPGALGDGFSLLREGKPFTGWGKYGKTLYYSRREPRAYELVANTLGGGSLFRDRESSHSPTRYVEDMEKLPTHFLTLAQVRLRRRTLGQLLTTEDADRIARLLDPEAGE